jgi:hypothetical protein
MWELALEPRTVAPADQFRNDREGVLGKLLHVQETEIPAGESLSDARSRQQVVDAFKGVSCSESAFFRIVDLVEVCHELRTYVFR